MKSWNCAIAKGDEVNPRDLACGDLCDRQIKFILHDGTEEKGLVVGGSGDVIHIRSNSGDFALDIVDVKQAFYNDDLGW